MPVSPLPSLPAAQAVVGQGKHNIASFATKRGSCLRCAGVAKNIGRAFA